MKYDRIPLPSSESAGEDSLTSETLKTLNGLQKQKAIARFQEAHPERELDLENPNDRNEVMLEWTTSGAAAEFAREFGKQDPAEIRKVIELVQRRDEEERKAA